MEKKYSSNLKLINQRFRDYKLCIGSTFGSRSHALHRSVIPGSSASFLQNEDVRLPRMDWFLFFT